MPAQFPQKDKKKRGYCECCGKKYEDLQTVCEMSSVCFDTIIFNVVSPEVSLIFILKYFSQ